MLPFAKAAMATADVGGDSLSLPIARRRPRDRSLRFARTLAGKFGNCSGAIGFSVALIDRGDASEEASSLPEHQIPL